MQLLQVQIPQAQKESQLKQLLGSLRVKAASKNVGEIDPRSYTLHYLTQVLPPFDFLCKIGDLKKLDLIVYKIKFVDTLLQDTAFQNCT